MKPDNYFSRKPYQIIEDGIPSLVDSLKNNPSFSPKNPQLKTVENTFEKELDGIILKMHMESNGNAEKVANEL